MHRLFIAIDFPEPVRAMLALLQSGLPDARWVPEEQVHLTVRFVGEVEGSVFTDIREALATVQTAPFEMAISGTGHFPPRGKPTVLWVGVTAHEPLARLRHQVEEALATAGIGPEGRKFAPHITLARLRGTPVRRVADYLAHHAGFVTEPFTVETFHLYSSILSAGGAKHRLECSYPLGPFPPTPQKQ